MSRENDLKSSRDETPDRRDALISAAAELLLERGLAFTRTRDVTARAGVGVGLLNHYFSWSELRAVAIGRALEAGVRELIPSDRPIAPSDAFDAFLASAFAENLDPLWRLWIEATDAAMTDPGIAAQVEAAAWELHGRLAACLAAGAAVRAWRCADPDGAALRLLAAHDGFSGFILGGVPPVSRPEAERHLRHLAALECPRGEDPGP